jgi:hypothetical protein
VAAVTRGVLLAGVLAGALAATPLAAQPMSPALPDSGARVRIVRARAFDVVGTLVARDSARWLVRTMRGDTVTFVPGHGRRLDVSTGTLSPGAAFMRTARPVATILATATLVATVATEVAESDDDSACMALCFSDAAVVAVSGAAATLYGGLVAGVVGLTLRDRWERVPLPADARLGVIATPGGAGIALRVALP